MKKLSIIAMLFIFIGVACKKNTSSGSGGSTVPDTYLPLTTGTNLTYRYTSSGTVTNPVLTVQAGDTTAFTKKYKIVKSSLGGNSYYNQTGNDYYTLANFGGALGGVELLFLKDNLALNGTWTSNQSLGNMTVPGIPIPVAVTLNFAFKIAAKGTTRTVLTKTFNDVIQTNVVITAVTAFGSFAVGSGDFYFSKNIGIVENSLVLDNAAAGIAVNEKYQLTAYDIK